MILCLQEVKLLFNSITALHHRKLEGLPRLRRSLWEERRERKEKLDKSQTKTPSTWGTTVEISSNGNQIQGEVLAQCNF